MANLDVLPYLGKGCYMWRPGNIFGGDVNKIVKMMVDAKVQHVCIKVCDGYYTYPDIAPVANALRLAGIVVGAWGYTYMKWIPLQEAEAIARGAKSINAAYLLHDIEDRASFFQWTNASRYIKRVMELVPNIPQGMNSYWKPSWHTEIPYSKIRAVADYDAPQIYSRGKDPVVMYDQSKGEFARLWPRLPFSLPAGDMYFEGGVKPHPGDVTNFMRHARRDPDAKGCVMWCADQRETTPELWAEFAAYDWDGDSLTPALPPEGEGGGPSTGSGTVEPLYAAVVTAWALNVRSHPSNSGAVVGYKRKGDRVTVYLVDGSWARISSTETGEFQWVSTNYLTKL